MSFDPGTYEPQISPRGSWRQEFTFNGAGIDFTGTEARAEVRNRPEGEALYISVSEVPSEDGYIIIPDGASNIIHVYFSPIATERLAVARGAWWDLFVEYPNGEDVDKLLRGKVILLPSVTDPSYD